MAHFEAKFKSGDVVRVVRENFQTDCSHQNAHHASGTKITLTTFDTSDGTWQYAEERPNGQASGWVSELCMEIDGASEEEIAAAMASITGIPNPNIAPDLLTREIFNPDDCPPGTTITVGNPDNGRLATKIPDRKGAQKNRWRDVVNGGLVNREDFRAGWQRFYPEES